LESGHENLIAEYEKQEHVSPGLRAILLANDHEALIAMRKSPSPNDNLEDDLPSMTMPFLLFVGESDPYITAVKEANRRLPNSTFFSLPDLNHFQAFNRSDLVLPHVKEFLSRVSK